MEPDGGGRLRRALARTAAGLGLGLVFVAALGGGALLHLDLPVARRTTESIVRSVLADVFEGSVEASGFEHLGLDGVGIGLVVVRDPAGTEVIRARHLRAHATVPTILRNLLGSGALNVGLSLVTIEEVDVLVEPNASGNISIAAAFRPRVKEPPPPPGRAVFFDLDRVEIASGHARGKPDGTRPLDADLRHLTGSVHVAPGLVTVDVEPTGLLERKMLPGAIAGTAEYHLRVFGPKDDTDTTTPSGTRMWTTFGGRVGELEIVAQALLEGDHVELSAHAPRARPEQVRALVPAYPVTDVVALDVEAKGDLPRIDFQIAAQTEKSGSLGASGHVQIAAPVRVDLKFFTTALDPRAALATAPAIKVTSKGTVHAELGPLVSVRIDAQTEATSLGETPIPAVSATALFDGVVWSGKATIHEPGAPTQATFSTAKDGAVRFDVTASVPSLAKVPRIPASARLGGAATVRAEGVVRGGSLEANVTGTVHGFRAGPSVAVRRADVRGRLSGPFATLGVDATVTADSAGFGGYGVQTATVRVTGPVVRPHVRASLVDMNDNHVVASAVFDPKSAAASRVKLEIKRDGVVAKGEIAHVGARGGALHIEGVALDSPEFGKVSGTLAVVRGELVGELHGERVDLGALRKLLGLTNGLAGTASIDISLAAAPGGRKGTVRVALEGGEIDAAPGLLLTGLTANVAATFDGDRVGLDGSLAMTGKGERCDRAIATLRLARGKGQLTGPLLEGHTWTTVTGSVDLAAEELDLACLAALVPVGLPVSDISGTVSSKATLVREPSHRFPSIRGISVTTRYLSIDGPEPFGAEAPTWASRYLDVELTADVNGDTGDATVSATLFDHERAADISLAAHLDLAALADPRRRAAALRTTEVAGHLHIPRRPIDAFGTLPTFVRDNIPELSGEMRADAYFAGPIARPRAVARLMGWNVAPGPNASRTASAWLLPFELDATAFYDSALATADVHVARNRAELLAADAQLTLPIEKLTGGGPLLGPWLTGRAGATMTRLPLGDLPVFGDRGLGGHLSGQVELAGIGTTPALHVDLRTTDLTIGPDVAFDEAVIEIRTVRAEPSPVVAAAATKLAATKVDPSTKPDAPRNPDRPATPTFAEPTALASVRFRDRKGGTLDLTGYMGIGWKDGIVPTPVTDSPADVKATLVRFPLGTAEPFLPVAIRKLGGLVDGTARVGWGQLDQTNRATVEVDLRVHDGAFYLAQLGQELRLSGGDDQPLHLVVERTGAVRVEKLLVRANTGKLTGSVTAQLDGFTLRKANAELTMPENEPFPVTLEGVQVGALSGTVKLTAEGTDDALIATASSSDLHLKLPSSTSRDVQSLDENPSIHISHTPEPEPTSGGNTGRPIVLRVDLDNMVVEGSGIWINLSTVDANPPRITLTETTRGTGGIHLDGGTVEVMGRKFEVDPGLIQLREQAISNPYLNVSAGWTAPDGSRIVVEYIGSLSPITRDKLRFRSNPPRTQQETMAVLLFGSTSGGDLTTRSEGGQSSFGNTVGEAAAGLGGELAAQQFNQLLKGIAPLKGLSTRFVAGDTGIKSSIVYQVGDTVSAVATYEAGSASSVSGSGTGATTAPGASVSVDWRFYKNWLIRASVGTSADVPRGEVDLLWQYRY